MDPLARHLSTEAFNNGWANHRLLGACALLGRSEFEAPRTGFFPSIRATLNRALTVVWYYIDAIERSLGDQAPNDAFTAFRLAGTSVAPPQLDEFFCTVDAPLRAGDFLALGFSKAAVRPAE